METHVSGNKKRKNIPPVEVHAKICSELTKLLDKVASILPALESAQPGSTQGLKTLCSINCSIGKGKLVIQHCSECSKLYLALTGDRILARCERLRSSVIENLSLIQSMVPMALADQVTEVINYLKNIKFSIDPGEEAAGKAIYQLLHQINSSEEKELKTFQRAASGLNLTSQKALLIEKRSIRKLLDEVSGKPPENENNLKFLYNLLVKHARNIKPLDPKVEKNQRDTEDETQFDTFEVQEFDDVNDDRQNSSLEIACTPNSEPLDQNKENPSPNNFNETNRALSQVLFPWNRDYLKAGSFSEFNPEKFLTFFKDLAALENEKQSKAVEDVVRLLERDVDTCYLMLMNGFEEALIEFLELSFRLSDAVAQKIGACLFLAFLRNNRVEFPTFTEEILRIVTPFLDPETTDALIVLQKFSQCFNSESYSPSKNLTLDDINIVEICMEIVCELSSEDNTKSQIFSSGYLRVLASILSYEKLAMCSLKVLEIYGNSEEGARLIGENPKFISCLVELLETSTNDRKEVSVSILYSICSLRHENCYVVRDQFVVPALVHLSVNGSEIAIEMSHKLLQLLRDLREDDDGDLMGTDSGTVGGTCNNKEIVSKTCPIMQKKKGIFARFLSLAHF